MTSAIKPPAEHVQRPLSESIAAATRSVHAKLNKLIIARLPLAIPPRSTDPSIYVSGLLHITPIYIAFESIWKEIVESSPFTSIATQGDGCEPGLAMFVSDSLRSGSNIGHGLKHQAVCERTRSILKLLYLPELMRSDRLRADITSLTGWSSEIVDEQLRAVSAAGRLAEFTRHVKHTIEKKPHVLLAYSYILFMALFAGGRFIRATLESAGSEFWEQVPSSIPSSQTEPVDLLKGERGTLEFGKKHFGHTLPLSFFHFATVLDGEDLKKEFKKRSRESEGLLTTQERHDVIQEAICIFDNMLLLVGQLDSVCESDFDTLAATSWASKWPSSRLRDSVVVTHERRGRASTQDTEDNNSSNLWLYKRLIQPKAEAAKGSSPICLAGQPPAYCPASNSMRFEAKLSVPDRKGVNKTLSTDGVANVPSSSRNPVFWLSSRSFIVFVSNITLVAGLAAVVGLFLLSRKPVNEELTAEE